MRPETRTWDRELVALAPNRQRHLRSTHRSLRNLAKENGCSGPYHIIDQLGKSGMDEVYRARDTKLGRDVAIKILTRAFANDAERLASFEREARMLALKYPNIGAIYECADADGIRALVLELVDGETLADCLPRGPLPAKRGAANHTPDRGGSRSGQRPVTEGARIGTAH